MRIALPYWREVLLCITSLIGVLGIAEISLLLLAPQPTLRRIQENTPAMFRESEVLPYALRPNYQGRFRRSEFDVDIKINANGYRGQDFDLDKGARHRILILGDSFTFGHGVGESEPYAARLQDLLAKKGRGRVSEVINAGFASGYSPDTYYLFCRLYCGALKPDLVLIGFFVGNDIDGYPENELAESDSAGLPRRIVNTESHVDAKGYFVSRNTPLGYSIPILRQSHLFHLVGGALQRLHEPSRRPLAIYAPGYSEDTRSAIRKTERLLLEIKHLLDREGIPLRIVLIPTFEQVYPERYPFTRDVDLDKPQRIFSTFLRESGVGYFDLLPSMRAAMDKGLYFPVDQHWTRHGHEFAAREIAKYLEVQQVVPGVPTSR